MNQRTPQLNRLTRWSTCAALILSLASCGGSGLSDDPTGFIDLVPFYPVASAPGVVPANPNANLPLIMTPRRGWFAGQRVEYYDFGPVGNVRKRNAAGSEIREPSYANVFPMYFFFDAQGRPMFSKPAFNSKNGNWYMLGGKNPINPTPQPAPASGQERTDYYSTVYLRRPRNVLTDDARGSSEFQRPIIDNLAVNATSANTTGLFEVVEITVKDSGYRPDAIKSAATVARGVADGRLIQRNTGKVINCPLVDERTNIVPSAMNNNIPRPRIQFWYKTKMGECFLANGWETIGEVVDENQSAGDLANLRLFGTGDLDKRINTFDSFDYDVGAGQPGATHATVAGVGKVYMPLLFTTSGQTRATNDALFTALPRHKATDPAGYSPIAWLHDIAIPATTIYQPGSIKDVANVDLGAATPRDLTPVVTTNNIAVLGPANKCVTNADCKWGMTCNLMPDDATATGTPDPGSNIVDMMIFREGGPRCDAPVVGYGQFCSPGVSRCDVQAAAGGENDKRLKAMGLITAGPTFTVHADLMTATTTQTTAATNLMTAQAALATAMAAVPADMTDPGYAAAVAAVATAQAAVTAAMTAKTTADTAVTTQTARVAMYDALGYTTDFAGFGYFCYPPQIGTTIPPTLGGFCHIRCDGGASATASMVTVDLPLSTGGTFSSVFAGEARCGGLNLLGYKCLPTTQSDPRQRVCMRSCNFRNTTAQNVAICDYQLNQKPDMSGGPVTGFSFSDGQPIRTAITGQMCASIVSTASTTTSTTTTNTCSWNQEFEPRDPAEWGGP